VFVINRPGSYYLTTNVTGVASKYGIGIYASNVTLDLNGFALLGVSNAFDGLVIFGGYSNVVVRNGTLSDWGTGFFGIRALGRNALLEDLHVSGNSFGVLCVDGGVIRNCTINHNQRGGIDLQGAGCFIMNNTLAGNNLLNGPGNASLSVIGAHNRIEGNHVTSLTGGGFGIHIPAVAGSTNNLVFRNSVAGLGGANYSITAGNVVGPLISTAYIYPAGNDVGPIGTAAAATSPWANLRN
jgi:hypothetical protein